MEADDATRAIHIPLKHILAALSGVPSDAKIVASNLYHVDMTDSEDEELTLVITSATFKPVGALSPIPTLAVRLK